MLEKKLAYTFKNKLLLKEALAHNSSLKKGFKNYERLEFIGDRVLNFVLSDYLFDYYSLACEGELSKRLSVIISRPTVLKVALSLNLSQAICVSQGEKMAGTPKNETIQADVMEAILGAVYKDSSFSQVRQVILYLWGPFLKDQMDVPQDSKSYLQEWSQRLPNKVLPCYTVTEIHGMDHEPIFTVTLTLEGFEAIVATGSSKKKAQQEAAKVFKECYIDRT